MKKVYLGIILGIILLCMIAFPTGNIDNSLVTELNKLYVSNMNVKEGSFTVNTSWYVGDENWVTGNRVTFQRGKQGLSYTQEGYDTFVNDETEPIQTFKTAPDCKSLLATKRGEGFCFTIELEKPPVLEDFFNGLWKSLDETDVAEIEKMVIGSDTRYDIVFSPDYYATHSQDGEWRSAITCKGLKITVSNKGFLKSLECRTEGTVIMDGVTMPSVQITIMETDFPD